MYSGGLCFAPLIITLWFRYLPALSSSIPFKINWCNPLIFHSDISLLSLVSSSKYSIAFSWLIASKCSFTDLPPIVIPSNTTFVSFNVKVLPSIPLLLYVHSRLIAFCNYSVTSLDNGLLLFNLVSFSSTSLK